MKMILPEALFPEKLYLDYYLQIAPDLLEFTVIVNDLLSFYKESIVSTERNNYVLQLRCSAWNSRGLSS